MPTFESGSLSSAFSSFAEGFSEEVKMEIFEAQNGFCKLCTQLISDFHHRLENTSSNRKLFPLYVSSVFNCVGLCRECHIARTSDPAIVKPTLSESAVYEHALSKSKGE